MHRHAIRIGHRALIQQTEFSLLRTTSCQPISHTVARVHSRPAGALSHNATTENTKFTRFPSTVIASRYGSHRRVDEHAFRPGLIGILAQKGRTAQLSQRRSFSDDKTPAGNSKTPNVANNPTSEPSSTNNNSNPTILERLPHIHRPTKYELLSTATSFWQRLRINFKWISIRSVRPFNTDEIGAFVSWIFLGHIIWIVIGTTTFVSLAIYGLNTVFAQETLAGWVGNYLTKSSGVKVVFESAIVPTWRSGVITFSNVFVSRRPGKQTNREKGVVKGSPTTAAAAAEAAMLAERQGSTNVATDTGNYSQFDVTMDTINVSLSFTKWFNGKGLLRDVEIIGVRGVIDRTNVQPRDYSIDPKSYRHEHSTGDFEIENFKMSDVLLTVHQPSNFRPFTVSVFNCDLPRLRKQWLFYDFMSANNMSGSFDGSLFTVHPRQVHSTTGVPLVDGKEVGDLEWKKHSRLRIDGLKIDHLNRGVSGPFSWIREGNVDIVADVMIPSDDENVWRQSWRDLYGKVEGAVSSAQTAAMSIANNSTDARSQDVDPDANVIDNTMTEPSANHETTHSALSISQNQSNDHSDSLQSEADKRPVLFDLHVNLNDIRAQIPLFTRELSYVSNAAVRPVVAYLNSRRAFIPVTCRVVKRQSEFDGSWTIFDSGLLDDLSRETYVACVRDLEDGGVRRRRFREVGIWGFRLAAQALFVGLAGTLVL